MPIDQITTLEGAAEKTQELKTRVQSMIDQRPRGVASSPPEISATDIGASPVKVSTSSSPAKFNSIANALSSEAESYVSPAGAQRDQILTDMTKLHNSSQSYSPETIRKQEYAADQDKLMNDLNTDITAYSKATRDEVMRMRENPEGKLAGALSAQIENFEYDRYNGKDGLADKAIAAQYALNNAEYANRIAKDAVDAENNFYERQMNYYSKMYTALGNDLTSSEKAMLESDLRIKQFNVENLYNAKTAAMKAAEYHGAPAEVVLGIKNAQSPEEVWMRAGSYGVDPNLSLQRDKFAWDKWLAMERLKLTEAETEGKISKEQAEEQSNLKGALTQANKAYGAVQEALANKVGLNAATGQMKGGLQEGFKYGLGASPLGFGSGFAYGVVNARNAREDFESDIKQIVAGQTLGEFSKLGFSLAPVTEKELATVGSMADDLSAAYFLNEDGSVILRGSTGEWESNLLEYETQLEATIEALMNDPNIQNAMISTDLEAIEAEFNSYRSQ